MSISRKLDEALERITGLFQESTQFMHKTEDFEDKVKKIIKEQGVPIKEMPELIFILNNVKALNYDEYAQAKYAQSVEKIQERTYNPFHSQSSSMSDYYDNEVRTEHRGLLQKLRKSPEKKRMADVERKRRIKLIIEILEEI